VLQSGVASWEPDMPEKGIVYARTCKAIDTRLTSQIDNYTGAQLGEIIRKHKIVNPDTGNEVTEPVEFNLMFESNIGPTGQIKGYVLKVTTCTASADLQLPPPRDCPGPLCQLCSFARVQQWQGSVRVCPDRKVVQE
jgi:hypothetical protein